MHYTDRFPALTNKYYRQRETHSTFGCQYTYNAAVAAAAVYTYSERLTILFSVAFSLWCDVNSVMYQKKKSRRERGKSTATYYRRAYSCSSFLCCSIYPGYVYTQHSTAARAGRSYRARVVFPLLFLFFFFFFFVDRRINGNILARRIKREPASQHSTALYKMWHLWLIGACICAM
jgi:hypothetical protein